MRYVIVDDGRVVTIFAGPQDPSDKPGYVEIEDADYEVLINQPPTPEETKARIQRQIDDLERGYMMPRATREALLAYAVTLASSNGVTEAQLYAGNIAYRKVKDFDAQIAALRAQL